MFGLLNHMGRVFDNVASNIIGHNLPHVISCNVANIVLLDTLFIVVSKILILDGAVIDQFLELLFALVSVAV